MIAILQSARPVAAQLYWNNAATPNNSSGNYDAASGLVETGPWNDSSTPNWQNTFDGSGNNAVAWSDNQAAIVDSGIDGGNYLYNNCSVDFGLQITGANVAPTAVQVNNIAVFGTPATDGPWVQIFSTDNHGIVDSPSAPGGHTTLTVNNSYVAVASFNSYSGGTTIMGGGEIQIYGGQLINLLPSGPTHYLQYNAATASEGIGSGGGYNAVGGGQTTEYPGLGADDVDPDGYGNIEGSDTAYLDPLNYPISGSNSYIVGATQFLGSGPVKFGSGGGTLDVYGQNLTIGGLSSVDSSALVTNSMNALEDPERMYSAEVNDYSNGQFQTRHGHAHREHDRQRRLHGPNHRRRNAANHRQPIVGRLFPRGNRVRRSVGPRL